MSSIWRSSSNCVIACDNDSRLWMDAGRLRVRWSAGGYEEVGQIGEGGKMRFETDDGRGGRRMRQQAKRVREAVDDDGGGRGVVMRCGREGRSMEPKGRYRW